MTEDDTFRILAQRPFDEVVKIAMKHIINMETLEEVDVFLRKFGWTVKEFDRELGIEE